MEEEIWKDILGYEGLYMVSNLGRIMSTRYNKKMIKKTTFNNKGYELVTMKDNFGKLRGFSVHRLVARHFIGESELTVDHKNDIKTDNRASNLQYLSNLENNYKKIRNLYNKEGNIKYIIPTTNRKRFRVTYKVRGISYYIGTFDTRYQAKEALLNCIMKNEDHKNFFHL